MSHLNYEEFDFLGSHYRVWPNGEVDRYDGPKLGWNQTHSLQVILEGQRVLKEQK
jgi:hypothetical protein